MEAADVFLWGTHVGVVALNDGDPLPKFQYMPGFIDSGIELSPLKMPLSADVYSFPELFRTEAFNGLPGLLADSLPDKFGNAALDAWLVSGIEESDLMACAREANLSERKARVVMSEVKEAVRGWPDFANEAKVNEFQMDEISRAIGC